MSVPTEEAYKQALAAKITPTAPASSSNTITYRGKTLTYLTKDERTEQGLGDDDDAAARVAENGRIALYDKGEKRWFYLDGGEEVLSDTVYDYGGQTHYNYEGAEYRGEAIVVPISQVDTAGMGNRQEDKLKRIREGITTGTALPPIDVKKVSENSYRAVNGFNRVEASNDKGFTHIPVIISQS